MLSTGHPYCTVDKILEIIHIEEKDQLLNILKQFYIYYLSKQKQWMNDIFIDIHNSIFDLNITLHSPIKQEYVIHPSIPSSFLLPPPPQHKYFKIRYHH
jgi:hypothetical protein